MQFSPKIMVIKLGFCPNLRIWHPPSVWEILASATALDWAYISSGSCGRVSVNSMTSLESNFVPSAMKLRRLCFYTCLTVHRGGGLPQCMLGYHPSPSGSRHPPGPGIPRDQAPPPRRRLWLRMVRILLECITFYD